MTATSAAPTVADDRARNEAFNLADTVIEHMHCGREHEARVAIMEAIAAITGSATSTVPGRDFQPGDRIEWQGSNGTWFPGKIVAVRDRVTTYDAKLDDGCDAENFAAGRFRRVTQANSADTAGDVAGLRELASRLTRVPAFASQHEDDAKFLRRLADTIDAAAFLAANNQQTGETK